MTQARRTLVSLSDTPYYHCLGRCVRRAFLCGQDFATGRDYEHRKHWVVERLRTLGEVFTIDVAAYAVMSNHYHVIVRIDAERAAELTDAEVMARWNRLFSLPLLVERYRAGETAMATEMEAAQAMIADYRCRLCDLSWFMRCLNEHIARRANAEDGCTGRFWEGRFKSQALLDERALLTCMSYVDLNPVRAGIARTPEASDFTSIQQRIRAMQSSEGGKTDRDEKDSDTPPALMAFKEAERHDSPNELPFSLKDYMELVDWTGRAALTGKRGAIAEDCPPLLKRLGIDEHEFLATMTPAGNRFGKAMGAVDKLREAAQRIKQRSIHGMGQARRLFPPAQAT